MYHPQSPPSADSTFLATEALPTQRLTSRLTSRVRSSVSASPQTSTTSTALTLVRFLARLLSYLSANQIVPDTPLEESISALDEIRKAGKTKYIGLSECSAKTLRKANSSEHTQLFTTTNLY